MHESCWTWTPQGGSRWVHANDHMIGCQFDFLRRIQIQCGSGPACESVVTFNTDVSDKPPSRASSLPHFFTAYGSRPMGKNSPPLHTPSHVCPSISRLTASSTSW